MQGRNSRSELISGMMLWSYPLYALNEKLRRIIIRVADQLKLVKPILAIKPQKTGIVLTA